MSTFIVVLVGGAPSYYVEIKVEAHNHGEAEAFAMDVYGARVQYVREQEPEA